MCSPGLEVEVEFAAPLALGGSVGDDHLDRGIVDLVGNEAPAVEEVPQVGAERWIGESNAHGKSGLASWRVRGPGSLTADAVQRNATRSVQQALIAPLAAIGVRRGYRAVDPRYEAGPAPHREGGTGLCADQS